MDEQGNSVFLKEMGALWRYEADLELCWTNADRPGDKVRSFLHVIGTNEAPDKAKRCGMDVWPEVLFLK